MASQMLPNPLKFMKRGRGFLREIFKFNIHNYSIYTGRYDPVPNNYKITNSAIGEMAPNLLQIQLSLSVEHETCNNHKL